MSPPILPENRDRYPSNWKDIRARILRRSSLRWPVGFHENVTRIDGYPLTEWAPRPCCECRGECGHDHAAERAAIGDIPGPELVRCAAPNGVANPITGSKVVLTVAHLDHQPENCADENLKAMCQRCHLAYDRGHHRETRRARKAIRDLFPPTDHPEGSA